MLTRGLLGCKFDRRRVRGNSSAAVTNDIQQQDGTAVSTLRQPSNGLGRFEIPRSSTAAAYDPARACLGIDADNLHDAVKDLYRHRMSVYWVDFLSSLLLGYAALVAFLFYQPTTFSAAAFFLCAVLACYRAATFIHELAHMRRKFVVFHIAWNVLCGIPQLIPSFLYEMHMAHHAPNSFGSPADGEYLPLARLRWIDTLGVIGASLVLPATFVFRFLISAPLSWVVPQMRKKVLSEASAFMILDGDYRRPLHPGPTPFRWLVQEGACFVWCTALLAGTLYGIIPLAQIVEVYVVFASVSLLNALRVITAHRYRSSGEPMSLAQQVLDTNTFLKVSAELWAPVGLRYHAVHHLLPRLPYHALPEAHRRIMARIPPDSPYKTTLRRSFFPVLAALFRPLQPQHQS
jgi:fatty acid desaturase